MIAVLGAVGLFSQAEKLYGFACRLAPEVGRYGLFACPASPEARPQIVKYQETLTDFSAALASGDETFLTTLRRTDFKIRTTDLCTAADWLSERAGPEALSEAGVAVLLRSIPENHACNSGSWMLRRKSVSLPVVLLDRALFPHAVGEKGEGDRSGCDADLAVKYWPRQSELIKRIVQKSGMPADFSQAAAGYRALFDKLKAMSPQSYESACRQALLTGQPSPEFIFSSASCRGMELLQRRWRLQKAYGSSDDEAAAHVCNGARSLDLAMFEETLTRWTPSVRAAGR
jgi:hypothetical protein